jgi:hypothetical protein
VQNFTELLVNLLNGGFIFAPSPREDHTHVDQLIDQLHSKESKKI